MKESKSNVLKEIISSQGFTYDSLAEATQLSRSNIINIVHGRSNPTLDSLLRICNVLNLSNEVFNELFVDQYFDSEFI